MDSDQRWYFLERARTSLEMATRARDPGIAAIHLDLYSRYMDQAIGTQTNQPGLEVVCSTPVRLGSQET